MNESHVFPLASRRPAVQPGRAAPAARGLHPALAAQPAAACELQGQPARLLVVLDLPGPVRPEPVRGAHRQRPADPRLLQGRAALSRSSSITRRRSSAASWRRPITATPSSPRRSQENGWLHLAADPLLLQHAQPRPSRARARAADLDAHRRAVPARSRSAPAARAAATSSGTGSAPTTRAATWSRA